MLVGVLKHNMAKKAVVDNRPFCDTCKFAEWHTQQWNINWKGEPITFGCTKGIFEHGEVRGTRRACKLWQSK